MDRWVNGPASPNSMVYRPRRNLAVNSGTRPTGNANASDDHMADLWDVSSICSSAKQTNRCVRSESARNVVVHDNGYAEHLRGLRSEEHGFTGTRSGIKVMAFDLNGLGLSFVDGLGYEQESITPSSTECYRLLSFNPNVHPDRIIAVRALYSDSDLMKRNEECTGGTSVTATLRLRMNPLNGPHLGSEEERPVRWTTTQKGDDERPTKEKLS